MSVGLLKRGAGGRNFVHKSQRYLRGMKRKEYYNKKIRFPYDAEFSLQKREVYSLDEKDIFLLKHIHEDARLPLTEIGKKLNISHDAVDYRLKKLIRSGIIKAFILRLNYHLLHQQYTTIMLKFHSISQKRKATFLNYLYEDERFYALMEQIGKWDISLMMFFSDAKDLRDFLMTVKEKFSDVIHSHDSVIHFDQYYYSYLCDGVVEELVEKVSSK